MPTRNTFTMPRNDEHGFQTTLAAAEANGDLDPRLRIAYERAIKLDAEFTPSAAALESNAELTDVGKSARRRMLAEPLVLFSTDLDREANEIERGLEVNAANVLAEELRGPDPASPAAVVDELRQLDLRRRLEAEDPIYREAYVKAAAARGERADRDLVRAALTAPPPPMPTPAFPGAEPPKWQSLLTPQAITDVKAAIIERRSPQGPDAWRAIELRGLARRLRHIAGVERAEIGGV